MKFPLMGRWAEERCPQTAIGLRLFCHACKGAEITLSFSRDRRVRSADQSPGVD